MTHYQNNINMECPHYEQWYPVWIKTICPCFRAQREQLVLASWSFTTTFILAVLKKDRGYRSHSVSHQPQTSLVCLLISRCTAVLYLLHVSPAIIPAGHQKKTVLDRAIIQIQPWVFSSYYDFKRGRDTNERENVHVCFIAFLEKQKGRWLCSHVCLPLNVSDFKLIDTQCFVCWVFIIDRATCWTMSRDEVVAEEEAAEPWLWVWAPESESRHRRRSRGLLLTT